MHETEQKLFIIFLKNLIKFKDVRTLIKYLKVHKTRSYTMTKKYVIISRQ